MSGDLAVGVLRPRRIGEYPVDLRLPIHKVSPLPNITPQLSACFRKIIKQSTPTPAEVKNPSGRLEVVYQSLREILVGVDNIHQAADARYHRTPSRYCSILKGYINCVKILPKHLRAIPLWIITKGFREVSDFTW